MGKLRNESGRRPQGEDEEELPLRSGSAGKLRAHELDRREVMEIVAGIEPGKVSLLEADPDAMSPEVALEYAGWLLDGVGREWGEVGTLASAFAFLDEPARPRRDLRQRVGGAWRGKASLVRRIAETAWAQLQSWVPSLAPRAAAVQRAATGASWAASPVDIATRATSGGGSALPHLTQIQRSFGRHDVTRVRAYDGEAARAGARQLAARAFTVGEAIGFSATPDLRLAAHEAAHVIQQRAGHAPSGGIDTPGDRLELHADAVADAVVSGRSAEGLLDDVVGSGGSAAIGVQREGEAPTVTSRTEDPAPSGGGTERTTVGVGEKVTFTGSASGEWTATGGTASGSGETFDWTAPGSPGQFCIKLTVGDKHVTKDIGVIGPTSVKFTRTDAGGPADGAELVGAWMNLDMQILPLNVTFKNITIREKPGGAHAVNGYFAFAQGKGEDLSHHPSEDPTLVRADNTTNKLDEASFVETASQPWPKPFTVGSMTWHIPYLYSAGDVTDKSFTIVAQTAAIVDSKGTVTLTKGTASFTRSPRAQTQAPQRRATAEARTADPLDIATRATTGTGAPLPHLDRIQDAFGRHDVSAVRTHDAGGAARELGAKAFAIGDAIGFAGAPDLHTAAHEAAHVVQQRAGARPDGGLDTPGDALERHADRVADAVVAGRSAEGLLDELGGGGPTRAVQRKVGDSPYDDDEPVAEAPSAPMAETPQDWGPKYKSADKDYAKYVDSKYQHGKQTDVGPASSHGGTKIDLDAKPLTGAEVQQIVTDPGGMRADIAKKLTPEHCESVAQHANSAFRAMQMDTLESVALYLAHAAVESGATTQLAAQADPASVGQFKGRGPLQVTFKENYAETLGAMDARAEKIKEELATEQNLTKKDKLQADYELITKASKAIKEDPANAEKPEYAYIFSAAHMAASGGIEKSANLEGQDKPEFPGNADTDSWETGEKETWAAKRARETNPDRQKYLDGVISAQKRKASAYQRAHGVLQSHLAAKQEDGAVQRHAVGDATTSSPVDTARAATSGAGNRLPHLATIQVSFGAHDVSNVRAHVGGAAADGATALGASAFAVGDAVGFAASPDLRTAAHEAAHVVQQRAGLAPDGGIDRRGDALERHADAVADTVAAGGSAAPLLDGLAKGDARTAVQRTGTAPKITVVTKVAPGGGGTARTTVGVGEKVTFKGSEAGTWTATGGSPTGANGDAFEWTAPGNPGQFSIKLKVGDQETQTGMGVIAPTGIQVKRTTTFKPGDDHMLGAGMWLKKTVLPLHVSFEGMTVKEQGGGVSGNTGYFQGGPGGGQDLTHYPDGDKGKFGADAPVNSVNELGGEDKCQLMDKSSDPWPRPIQVGSMTWQVPHLYTAGGVSDKSFTIMAQTMGIVDSKGTVTITKGKGAQYSRTPTQPMWNPGSSGGTDGEVDTPKSEQDASDRRVGATPEPDESDDGGITVTDGFATGTADDAAPADGGGTDDAAPADGRAAGDNRRREGRRTRARPAAPPPGPATVTHRTRETPLEGGGGPDRLTVGVGERVDFTSTQTGTWTATGANRGTRRTQHGRTYRWQAPPAAGSVTVTFTPGAAPARAASPPAATGTTDNPAQNFEFTIVAPNDLQFLKTSEDNYRAGRQGAGMHQSVYMLPMTVSFANVQWLEVPGPASSPSGYFSSRRLPSHHPNRRWLGLNNANGGITDHAAFWGFPSPWAAGSFTWVIPNKYRVDGEGGAGHEFVTVNQVCTMEGAPFAGRTTVTKGTPTQPAATVTRDPSAAPPARGRRGRRGEASPDDERAGAHRQDQDGTAEHSVAGDEPSGVGKSDSSSWSWSDPTTAERRQRLEKYLGGRTPEIWQAVRAHLTPITFPDPHTRVAWARAARFAPKLVNELVENVGQLVPVDKLDELIHPATALETVGSLVPEGKTWYAPIGLAIAQAMQIAVVASLRRMGRRILEVADARGLVGAIELEREQLIPSVPLDRHVIEAIRSDHIITIAPASARATKPTGKVPTLRRVELEWQPPPLWNWVRAVKPADATAEEVAASLWHTTDGSGDKAPFNSYLLAAAPPLFGVPKRAALEHPKAQAPKGASATGDNVAAQLTEVAGSKAADDIALHQTQPAASKPVTTTLLRELDRCGDQLEFISKETKAWDLDKHVEPARAFNKRKRAELATPGAKDAEAWANAVAGQLERLYRIGGEIHRVTAAGAKIDRASQAGSPIRAILKDLAVAAGTSHFAQTSEARLAAARVAQALLDVRAVQSADRDLEIADEEFRAQMAHQVRGGDVVAARSSEIIKLRARSRELQTQLINQSEVDRDEVDEVTLRQGEIALSERLLGLMTSSIDLRRAASAANDGLAAKIAKQFSGKFGDIDGIATHITTVADRLYYEINRGSPPENAKVAATMRGKRRAALTKAQAGLATLAQDTDLSNFFRESYKLISDQQFRIVLVKAAGMLGVAIASAVTAGAAAEAVGTSFMTARGVATVAELSLGARAGMLAAQMATDITLTSIGQATIQGGSLRHAFVENMFTTFASTALFGTIAHARKASEVAPLTWKTAETLGHKAAVLGLEVVGIGVHTLWGAAIGYVAGKVGGGPEPTPMQAREWMLQGASVFLGRRIHAALGTHMPSIERLAARSEAAKHLLAQAQELRQLAARVEQTKNAEAALELIERQTKFLADEIEVINKLAARGDASGELAKARTELQSQLDNLQSASLLEPKFHLAGLRELIPGALWTGTREQIQNALTAASKKGAKPSQDPRTKNWKLEVDGRTIELKEVADPTRPRRADHSQTAAEVPHSNFTARARPGEPARPVITEVHAKAAAADAARILGPKVCMPGGDGKVTIAAAGQTVAVEFKVPADVETFIAKDGSPNMVARHDYKVGTGQTTVTVEISPQARQQDLVRAAAHEIAEIHALLERPSRAGNKSLESGSKATTPDELSHHDLGRKAELEVVLHEIDRAAGQSRADLGAELKALVQHLGFEPASFSSDARARALFGDRVKVVQRLLNELQPHRPMRGKPTPEEIAERRERALAIKEGRHVPETIGEKRGRIGSEREDAVAALVGGSRSGEEIRDERYGRSDVDVVGPNKELVFVGGAAKVRKLENTGRVLRLYRAVAEARGVRAMAYLAADTPQAVIDLAKKILGPENVTQF